MKFKVTMGTFYIFFKIVIQIPQFLLKEFAIEKIVELANAVVVAILFFFMFAQCKLASNQKVFKTVRIYCNIEKLAHVLIQLKEPKRVLFIAGAGALISDGASISSQVSSTKLLTCSK